MRIRCSAIAIVVAFIILPAANAHEFWIEASDYAPPPDEDIELQILIGKRFSGSPYPYLENLFFKFESRQSGTVNDVDGLDGDDFQRQGCRFTTQDWQLSPITPRTTT